MANWKKVIVSGSIADLAQISASTGIFVPTSSLNDGIPDNFILTVAPEGNVEKLDPKLVGSAFQSMSVAGTTDLGDFGHDTFIAEPGLNELIFVSGSNIELETSHSIEPGTDATGNVDKTTGYIKITAITGSVGGVVHMTNISSSDNISYIETAQAISTGSNVTFGTISGSKLTVTNDNDALAVFENSANKANIKISDEDTTVYVGVENDRATIGSSATPSTNNLNININANAEGVVGNVGIGTKNAPEKLTVRGNISASGHITASGDIFVGGDATVEGDLGLGGVIFGLTGFGVTIDDVAITSGSVNFGSGSNPALTDHKFTGSVFITGSQVELTDGIFSGSGLGLTNIVADNLIDVEELTWGYGFTSSDGSAYNPTSSIKLHLHISGSEITSSENGLYIPGSSIRLDHITASTAEGDILTWSGSARTPSVIPVGIDGHVLTSNGPNATASFKSLPPTLAMGIMTGSGVPLSDSGNAVSLLVTSSLTNSDYAHGMDIISDIPLSGSDNQISVSGSVHNNTVHFRLADNIKGISSITASVGIQTDFLSAGNISASGDLTVAGDFTVLGDTSLVSTTNLLVEDAFITLATGSSGGVNVDGGIIIKDATDGGGRGFGWDNTYGRWGLQDALSSNTTTIDPAEWIVSAKLMGASPSVDTTPNYGQANGSTKRSSGQLWINTGSGDIWIYVD